jgi:hypothetical protein
MTFRKDAGKREAWRKWVLDHREELIATGVPVETYSDERRWLWFLQEGGTDYLRGFDISQLSESDANALYRLIQKEYGNKSYRGLLRRLEDAFPGLNVNGNPYIGRFEVTSHFEIIGRGAFVVGQIRGGLIRVGMYVDTQRDPPRLRVAGVEFLDNIAEKKYWNALVFAERPTLDFVEAAFPIGSVLELRTDESDEATR